MCWWSRSIAKYNRGKLLLIQVSMSYWLSVFRKYSSESAHCLISHGHCDRVQDGHRNGEAGWSRDSAQVHDDRSASLANRESQKSWSVHEPKPSLYFRKRKFQVGQKNEVKVFYFFIFGCLENRPDRFTSNWRQQQKKDYGNSDCERYQLLSIRRPNSERFYDTSQQVSLLLSLRRLFLTKLRPKLAVGGVQETAI